MLRESVWYEKRGPDVSSGAKSEETTRLAEKEGSGRRKEEKIQKWQVTVQCYMHLPISHYP